MKVLLALAALAGGQMPARPCLTQPEAEAVVLVALPDLMRQTGVVCAARLPASSLLRQPSAPMLQRFATEADRAWPAARAAFVKLSDPAAEALLGSQFARPLLATLITPLLVGRIAPKDCGTIDRLLSELGPLPPRNMAGVIVTTLRYLSTQKVPAGMTNPAAGLPLCAGTR